MPDQTEIPPVDPRAEMIADIFQTVDGITARFDRAWFLECARQGQRPDELWQAMADAGLLGVGVPEELGGLGGGLSGCTAVMEAMSRAGVPAILYTITCFSRAAILKHGSPQQLQEHVAKTATGERKICFGVTEPSAGTNSFAMRSTARRAGAGSYRVNGQKVFISGADEADHILLVARTAGPDEPAGHKQGFGLFILPMDSPGISINRMNIEWYGPEGQYEVFFDDVEVPAHCLIGDEGAGFSYLFESLNQERVMVAAWALGLGDCVLQKAVAYARERAPFGQPIGSYQAVQHPLALAHAEMESARLSMYRAAATYDDGGDAGPQANTAKLLGTRAALAAVEAAIQTHGGSAFVYETDIVTFWPMIRVLNIAPLNNESILNYVGERVLGLPRSY